MNNQPILLSILIPLTYDRDVVVRNLLRNFTTFNHGTATGFITDDVTDKIAYVRYFDFYTPDIEIILAYDRKESTIGEKREKLYQQASGLYSWQIDSDDDIETEHLDKILEAIKYEEPDCITFKERVIMDGVRKTSNHSLKYDKWRDNYDGYDYTRSAFYKDVIKTEIARSVPFPKIRWNEDEQWSMALMPHLKDEYHIDAEVYLYNYESTPFNERYGIKEDNG